VSLAGKTVVCLQTSGFTYVFPESRIIVLGGQHFVHAAQRAQRQMEADGKKADIPDSIKNVTVSLLKRGTSLRTRHTLAGLHQIGQRLTSEVRMSSVAALYGKFRQMEGGGTEDDRLIDSIVAAGKVEPEMLTALECQVTFARTTIIFFL
jgi:hypothetical protein